MCHLMCGSMPLNEQFGIGDFPNLGNASGLKYINKVFDNTKDKTSDNSKV